ncbi:hypothetical protein [Enterococcus faecium]|uniref:hypothetical protein n=1 Tax=Enterococcus faecium TaxID=1352 RepID=UPI0021A49F31|nr:hypothetical protein [Enterococcus faecium]
MTVNIENYAEKWQRELDQTLQQESLTAELETPEVNWLDAKTFRVSNIKTSGYKHHNRERKGFNSGTITIEDVPYTLNFDRDIEFYVDKADVDETNQAASAGNITRVFSDENATPEMDAYRFSKLARYADEENLSKDETITEANVVKILKAAILKSRRYGTQNLILYVSSQVMDSLEQSPVFTRTINVETNSTNIETRVTNLDGVKIKEVWAEERFYDSFDFTEGFVPRATSKKLNYLLVAKPTVIAKAKFASVYLFAPGQVGQGDGWLYQNRIYHDLFKMENQSNAVIASTAPRTNPNLDASPMVAEDEDGNANDRQGNDPNNGKNNVNGGSNFNDLNEKQLKAALTEAGIEFSPKAKKSTLIKLLEESE